MPRQNNTVDGASAARNTTNVGTETVPNFNDMMLVVQSHITTIKHDLLAAHNAAKAKQGTCASLSCQMHFLPSSSTCNSSSNLLPNRPLVLVLPTVSFQHVRSSESQDEVGSELNKRKRMLGVQNGDKKLFLRGRKRKSDNFLVIKKLFNPKINLYQHKVFSNILNATIHNQSKFHPIYVYEFFVISMKIIN